MNRPRAGRVLIAPDKFKGSLTAVEVAAHLRTGLLRARPTLTIKVAPVADGGEGTVEAALANGFSPLRVRASDALGAEVDALLALRDGTAVIEMAQASGLQLMAGRPLDAVRASTYGTGELIRAAMDASCHTVVLGVGGSASTDGGAGMLHSLGADLRDRHGAPVPSATPLDRVHEVDLSRIDPRIARTTFVVASDVDNPLLGPTGAATVYGPQKGASPDQVLVLERGLTQWAGLIADAVGQDYSIQPGAGAAGGVGFAAMAVLGAQCRSGIEILLELIEFDRLLDGIDLVITGEGSLDEQSLRGKAPIGVSQAAHARAIPAVAVAGRTTLSSATLASAGFEATYTLQQNEPDLSRCIAEAGSLLESIATAIANQWIVAT